MQFLPLSEMANMPLLQYGNSPLSRGESAEWVLLLSQLRVISVVGCVAGSFFSVFSFEVREVTEIQPLES